MRPWWKILDRLADIEDMQENDMQEIEALKVAQARLIDANRRLIAKVNDQQTQINDLKTLVDDLEADAADPAVVQALVDEANTAADNAEAVAPTPAS
jgi:hypothetical protein